MHSVTVFAVQFGLFERFMFGHLALRDLRNSNSAEPTSPTMYFS